MKPFNNIQTLERNIFLRKSIENLVEILILNLVLYFIERERKE